MAISGSNILDGGWSSYLYDKILCRHGSLNVDTDKVFRSAVLEFKHVLPQHQWITSAMIMAILKESNLHTRIRVITSDNGGEMLRYHLNHTLSFSLPASHHWHVRCVCFIIINWRLFDATDIIKRVIDMVRKILKTIRGSCTLCASSTKTCACSASMITQAKCVQP